MKHRFGKTFFAAVLVASLLLTSAGAVGLGHVNAASGLRLRNAPSTSGEVLVTMPDAAEVTALKLQNGWYTVRYQDTVGYVDAEYLDLVQTGAYAAPLVANIVGDPAALRSEPGADADTVTTLAPGAQVVVIGIQNSWYAVSFGSIVGYLHPASVELISATPVDPVLAVLPAAGGPDTDEDEAPAAEPSGEPAVEPAAPSEASEPADSTRYGIVTGSVVNVRAEATTSSDVLTKLNRGTKLVILDKAGDWCRIQYGDLTGYMSAEYVLETDGSSTGTSTLRQEIVDYARQYLGIMYRYGGKSPSTGFDCSGFVYYVFGHFGYTLNPGASNQRRITHSVTKSELLPGDLVFFNNGTASLASHVGIYIGGGNFIHSTSPGHPVSINSLSDSYYSRYYVGGGRVIFD